MLAVAAIYPVEVACGPCPWRAFERKNCVVALVFTKEKEDNTWQSALKL